MAYPHWTLFQVIDEDLHDFSRHVEFAEANFETYSIDLLRLYLSICSEVDVIAKLLCRRIGANLPDRPNMDHYRRTLKSHTPYANLSGLKITIRPMGREILPWEAWNRDQNPEWWTKHQGVKHERDQHFADADLKNVLDAAAGLLVFLTYWHQPELYTLRVSANFRVFEIEGIRAGVDLVGRFDLKDFGLGPTV